MKRLLFLVFFLVLPSVFAQDWVFNSEYLELGLDIFGRIDLVPTRSNYDVEYVIANLSFFPQDGFQTEVLDIKTMPSAEMKGGNAIFRWDEPKEKELDFSVKSNIKSFNKILNVRSKVRFPLKDLPDEVKIYTKPSETIDSDDREITKKVAEIIEGEDDLYVVVFKLGEWTKKNINYDLSTLTESVSQKASWVLKNKEGVCDELTNLFIAMNRALGIPAKFISGVAYTNAKEFEEDFGAHGWAEVYFPGYGWIPFDVTYGQFGFVDGTHVKLKESVDSNEASTKFQWLGKNVDIKTSQLDIRAEVKGIEKRVNELIAINGRAVKNNIGFGSYNLIEAIVENLENYYVATELFLSKSREIEIIGGEEKVLLLKPNEEKTVNWIVRVSDNLDPNYMYTFPFIVGSLRNVSAKLRFDVVENGKRFSLEGIESLVKEEREEKSYLGDVEMDCSIDKKEIYEYESSIVGCDIKNMGNVYLENLNVCLKECKKLDLGINQEGKVEFDFIPEETGAQEIVIKASNKDVSKDAFLDVVVYDKPSIEISELIYPEEVRYREEYEISFILNKKSMYGAYEVVIAVEPVDKEWEISQLNEDRRFVLRMYGSELDEGENRFRILVKYEDRNKKGYETSEEFNIRLVDVSLVQRIIIFFRNLFR